MDAFLSDLASGSERTRRINGPFALSLLSDKLLCHAVVGPYLEMPELLGVIERGQIYALPEGSFRGLNGLLERCEARSDVVLKPAQGQKGGGVIRLSSLGQRLELNGAPARIDEVAQLLTQLDDYLIEACAEQAAYASTIFSGSANTLRVVTMRDVDREHKPFIAAAIHKFGTHATAPTDNWTRGGLSAAIAVETGQLSRAAHNSRGANGGPKWCDAHPDTGATICGVTVPGWSTVKAQLLDVTEQLDFLTYVGWDVLVTETGAQLIEGNTTNVEVKSLQVHQPLLSDPRVRRFFEFYGVIASRPGRA